MINMKTYKNIFNFLLVLILAFTLIGCNDEKEEDDTPLPLDTQYTDQLKLNIDFAGKNFISDGIGEVSLTRCVDGDTISVSVGGGSITIRFLGIDTPESTTVVQPWGKAASAFVKEKLQGAYSIVLEAEGERKDNNNRYLAWVWYKTTETDDYRLLNLEEVELAYTKFTFDSESKYFNAMFSGEKKASKSGERVWGGIDPDYNYSKEVQQTSLLYLLNNPNKFQSGTKFELTVKLIRTNGNNLYLEDAYETSFDKDGEIVSGKGAAYAFSGYKISFYSYYNIGDIFTIQCQFQYEGDYGTQLTGLQNASRVIANEEPEIITLDANELSGGASLEQYYGSVVQVNNLKVVDVKEKTTTSGDDYYVVEAVNNEGDKFDIYFGNSLITKHKVFEIFDVGSVYNVIGGVAYYEYANGKYQLSVGDAVRYTNGEMNEKDLLRAKDIEKVN